MGSQPGSSSSMNREHIKARLEEFALFFVEEFEAQLNAYYLIFKGEFEKVGIDSTSGKIGTGIGAVAGYLLGYLVGFAEKGSSIGTKIGQNLETKMTEENETEKASKLAKLICDFVKDKVQFRLKLIDAAVEVFLSYELQLSRVKAEERPERAMLLLAKDAVNRAMNYYVQHEDAPLAQSILLGKSKRENLFGVPLSRSIKTPGFELEYVFQSNRRRWFSSSLYEKPVLVREEISSTKAAKYYKEEGSKSKPEKYGFRRPLPSETWDDLQVKYKEITDLNMSTEFTSYQYKLNPTDLRPCSQDIIKTISVGQVCSDNRIIVMFEEVKGNILDILRKSLERTTAIEDRNILIKIENTLKRENADEYLKKLKETLDEIKQHALSIQETVEEGLQENRENFMTIKATVDEGNQTNREIREDVRYLRTIITNPISLEKDNKEKGISFDVLDPIESFVGREKELEDMHDKAKNRQSEKATLTSDMILVCGLGGIGKSTVCRQYLHKHSNYFDENLIWINAENEDSLNDSFRRLAKDKLGIRVKDSDGDQKSIESLVGEVYTYFTTTRSSFVFDNAENGAYLKKYLPLQHLPPGYRPYVLITSRDQDWNNDMKVIRLDGLLLEDAKKLVRNALNSEPQNEDIEDLVKTLEYFPLAIQQAISYIQHQKRLIEDFDIKSYLRAYKKKTKELLESESFKEKLNKDNYRQTTYTTWKVTTEKIASDEKYGSLALTILQIMAYLPPDNIDRKLFTTLANEEDLLNAIYLIERYSMVRKYKNHLNVHRLVQEVTRLDQKETKRAEEVLAKAFDLITRNATEETKYLELEGQFPRILMSPLTRQIISIWTYACEYPNLIDQYSEHFTRTPEYSWGPLLHILAAHGCDKAIDQILRAQHLSLHIQSVLDTTDAHGRTPLFLAAQEGHENTVKVLIENKAKIDILCQMPQYYSPKRNATSEEIDLMRALESLHENLEKEPTSNEIKSKEEIDRFTSQGKTQFLKALLGDHLDRVKLLIRGRSNIKSAENTPAQSEPTQPNVYLNLIKYLANKMKFDGSTKDKLDGTALHIASFNGHFSIVELLAQEIISNETEHKRGIDIPNSDGQTPLHCASTANHLQIVDSLIGKGANAKAVDKGGWSLIHFASYSGSLRLVEYLSNTIFIDLNMKTFNQATPLHLASRHGHLSVVEFLITKMISNGIDTKEGIDKVDSVGDTPLLEASLGGHLVIVKRLHKEGANIKAVDKNGWSVMHNAARSGSLELMKYLVEEMNINVNIEKQDKATPLHVASRNGHLSIVELIVTQIISNGIDTKEGIDKVDSIGDTPLLKSALGGHLSIVKFLQSKGCNIKAVDKNGWSVLHNAAKSGSLDLMYYLVNEMKFNVNIEKEDKATALHVASRNGHLPVVEFLVTQMKSKGMDMKEAIDQKDSNGDTPLLSAALGSHLPIVKFLQGQGANLKAVDNDSWSILHTASQNGSIELVKFLVSELKFDINLKKGNDAIPLHVASRNGNLPVVEFLVTRMKSNGADINKTINQVDSDGDTPLLEAALGGHLAIVKFLYTEGADIKAVNNNRWSVLHKAAKSGSLELVTYVVNEMKFNINIETQHKSTPLHLASRNGHLSVVEFLVTKMKSDSIDTKEGIDQADSDGDTALLNAALGGHLSIVKFLHKTGSNIKAVDKNGWSVMHNAAKSGSLELIKYLVDKMKFNVNIEKADKATSLHVASMNGHLSVVEFLVTKMKSDGIETKDGIDKVNSDGDTALLRAALGGHLPIVKFLHGQGSNFKAVDNNSWTVLHTAAISGSLDLVKFLIHEMKFDINIKKHNKATPLHIASRNGHLPVVQFLLAQMKSYCMDINEAINQVDSDGDTPLLEAALGGHLSIVKFLYTEGADIKALNNNRWSVLLKAAKSGSLELVTYVVNEMKFNVNTETEDKTTPLHVASRNGHLAVVEFLVTKIIPNGGDIEEALDQIDGDGDTPLLKAALGGHLSIVKFLHSKSCNIKAVDKTGWSVLHNCAKSGSLELMQYLVNEMKLNANTEKKDKATPMHVASRNGHLSLVEFLIKEMKSNGMEIKEVIDQVDSDGDTPLLNAALGGHLDLVKFLHHEGANISAVDNNSWSVLHIAAKSGSLELVMYLVEEINFNVQIKTAKNSTPLNIAAGNGHLSVVEFLVSKMRSTSLDIDNADWEHDSPLLLATKKGHLPVVKFLTSKGANINHVNKNHWSVLHFAAESGSLDLMKYLLCEMKLDINTKTLKNETALDIALFKGHSAIVEFIQSQFNGIET